MEGSPNLQIRLLGNFQLIYGNTLLSTINTSRLKSLLAYLLLHRDAPQSRQHIAFLFWPDTSEAQARANLRNLIYYLRRALPPGENYLLVERQTIQWSPKTCFTLDVETFIYLTSQTALQADLQQAVGLYNGDLLPECYDDWIQPERESLRQTFIGVLKRLIQQLEGERNYSDAISYTQRLLLADPLQEETYRKLMQLYAANGARAKALHIYHSCTSVLERELGIEPGPELQLAYHRLLKVKEAPDILSAERPLALVGRQVEWRLIRSAWRATSRGQAQSVLVKGEPGIGKTRLVEEMVDWAEHQGIASSVANCYAAAGSLAYAPVTDWLHARPLPKIEQLWLSETARLLPELLVEHPDLPRPRPLTESWQRLRLFKALAHVILRDRLALILVIEDLQWCDQETIDWIAYLLQSKAEIAPRTRLLLIGTLRTGETANDHPVEALLADLRRGGGLTEIELGPLGEVETAALTRQVGGDEMQSDLVEKLYLETEGNPLFVVEMARLMRGKRPQEGEIILTIPSKVQSAIQARFGQLGPAAHDLAEVAAVIGRQFTFPVLRHAAGGEEEKLVRDLDELWRRRIVREHGSDAYDFSHDKLREVLYASLSSARKKLLHRRVAQAMEDVYSGGLDAVSGQIAAQYEQAGNLETAIDWYRQAAEASQRIYANQAAIEFFRKALDLLDDAKTEQDVSRRFSELSASVNEGLGDVLAVTRQLDDALHAYQAALVNVPPDNLILQARLHRKIGHISTDLIEALNIFDKGEEILTTHDDKMSSEWQYEWIELHLERLDIYHRQGLIQGLIDLIKKMKPIVEELGTPSQRIRYYIGLVYLDDLTELLEVTNQSMEYLNAALTAARQSGNLTDIAFVEHHLGTFQIFRDEFKEAEPFLRDALRLTEQTGDFLLKARCLCSLTFLFRRRGLEEEARHYVSLALEASQAAQSAYYVAISQANAAWVAWRDGKLEEAKKHSLAALAAPVFADEQMVWAALWPLVGVYVLQNHVAEAIECARQLFECKY